MASLLFTLLSRLLSCLRYFNLSHVHLSERQQGDSFYTYRETIQKPQIHSPIAHAWQLVMWIHLAVYLQTPDRE